MLALTRKTGQAVIVGGGLRIQVRHIQAGAVRLRLTGTLFRASYSRADAPGPTHLAETDRAEIALLEHDRLQIGTEGGELLLEVSRVKLQIDTGAYSCILGFDAPRCLSIHREEVQRKIEAGELRR